MTIDTSAIVGILFGEPEKTSFSAAIHSDQNPIISAVSVLEIGMVVEAKHGAAGATNIDALLEAGNVRIIAFDAQHARLAREAWRQFGKGRHPAALNFGDCCVYALAKQTGQPILCKGDDFIKTDIGIVHI